MVWRTLVFIGVFVGVGLAVAWMVLSRAPQAGPAQPEVRLAAAMAGLFAGGAAALVAGIVMLRKRG